MPEQDAESPGKALLDAGNYEQALSAADAVLQTDPTNLSALQTKAFALLCTGMIDEAIACYDEVLAAADDTTSVQHSGGNILSNARTLLHSKRDSRSRYYDALRFYDEVIQRGTPQLAHVYRQKAVAFTKLNRIADALSAYDQAISLTPEDPTTLIDKGDLLLGEARYNEAFACFVQAQNVSASALTATDWSSRGDTVFNKTQASESIPFYDRALSLEQDHPYAWRGKAVALRRDPTRREEALKCIDQALQHDPKNILFCLDRGNILYDLGRYKEAEACYHEAAQADPTSYYAHFNRSIALEKLGEFADALASADKALEISPNDVDAWVEKGVCLGYLKRMEESIAAYDKALSVQPTAYWALNNKGWALTEVGRNEEAIPLFDKAIELDPSESLPWTNKSKALRQIGRYDEAVTMLQSALDKTNDRASVLENLGLIYSEYLYDDVQAFEYFRQRCDISPADLDTRANVAECLIKLHKFDDGRREALEIAAQHENAITRCAMHIVVMASYAFESDASRSLDQFRHFLDSFRDVKPDERTESAWTFRGLLRQINNAELADETRFLLLTAIDLLLGRAATTSLSYFVPPSSQTASKATAGGETHFC